MQSFQVLLRTFWHLFWQCTYSFSLNKFWTGYLLQLTSSVYSQLICTLFRLHIEKCFLNSSEVIQTSRALLVTGMNLVTLFTWAANTKSWFFGLGDSTILNWIWIFCSVVLRIPKQPVYWGGVGWWDFGFLWLTFRQGRRGWSCGLYSFRGRPGGAEHSFAVLFVVKL